MEIGDFFRSAPSARPVNPSPVKFTAVSRDTVLPGGHPNPSGRSVAAECVGCFVFLDADDLEAARRDAKQALRERFVDKKTKLPLAWDDADLGLELMYQHLQRALRQWDEKSRSAGDSLFPDVRLMRQLVLASEARRLVKAYEAYVDKEHPEVVDTDTFRGAEGGGAGAAQG